MKTFKDFIVEAPTEAQAAQMAPAMSPEKRRAALEKNARRQAARDTPPNKFKPKAALPPGKTGGNIQKSSSAITKRPSSAITKPEQKSSAIVKAKTKPQPPKNVMTGTRSDDRKPKPYSNSYLKDRAEPESKPSTSKLSTPDSKEPDEKNDEEKRKNREWWMNKAKQGYDMATKDNSKEVETSKAGDLGGPQRRTSSRM